MSVRTDEATSWGDAPPELAPNPTLVEVTAYIRLPGKAKPIGSINAHAVSRDSKFYHDQSAFFWMCDEVSEEFINAMLTFCNISGAAANIGGTSTQLDASIKPGLKTAPHNIPDSCDTGPVVVVDNVSVDPEHRGSELGMDAMVAFLQSFRWSLALADISMLNSEYSEHERSGELSDEARAKRLADDVALKKYFERIHFTPGAPGGHPAMNPGMHPGMDFASEAEEGDLSRYHWLSRERFDRGEFQTRKYRLVAALQRLAFAQCVSTWLGSDSPSGKVTADLIWWCVESVPASPSRTVATRACEQAMQ